MAIVELLLRQKRAMSLWVLWHHCPQSNSRGGGVKPLSHVLHKETQIQGIKTESEAEVVAEAKVDGEVFFSKQEWLLNDLMKTLLLLIVCSDG